MVRRLLALWLTLLLTGCAAPKVHVLSSDEQIAVLAERFSGLESEVEWLSYESSTQFAVTDLDTEIIAASVRNPVHVTDCALAGADIATVPYGVIEQMVKHPLTDAGIAKFQADYRAVFGE